ncbi:MAG: sugar kinase [Nitrospinota bacterium]|nr:MAG: sugar kinase [Nitrospinota bacterium]
MALLVVGSIALDSVQTPFGEVRDVLGGSASYFAVAASYFAEVRMVGVIGEDFPDQGLELFRQHAIDIAGLEKRPGKTFRWKGEYNYDLNEAITLDTQLNVFQYFQPKIPLPYTQSDYVFLANIDPELQLQVLQQIPRPKLVACDTMNYWIRHKPEQLRETLRHVDLLTVNDAEARELTQEANIVKAARQVLRLGPKTVVIKRGEYGALMCNQDTWFFAPAYPLETVYDPTGAGDSFAGGMMGYLANTDNLSEETLRQGIILGSTMASFAVEAFSLNRLSRLTYGEIEQRFKAFKSLVHFEDITVGKLEGM